MRLGPYEIVAPLGAGGMGEVYRAHDNALNRDVAIKVLLPSVADDPDRLARFRREAQVLASLNHPNIAHIHGLEDFPLDGGSAIRALIMELVEGDDLSRLIARGPMPVDEALQIARQIAEALETAHEQGIIHRDLKPANIKVRPDGTVKVLDFGLAKALDPSTTSRVDVMNSPTLTAHATQLGMILGTAAYMAPEQARGRAVDRRADVWAFGAVLFEMLTGRRAFEGDDVSTTLAAVLKDEVKWDALPAQLPVSLTRLVKRCLDKDPKRRLQAIGEARVLLDDLLSGSALELPSPIVGQAQTSRSRRLRVLAGAGLVAAGAAAAWWLKPAPGASQVVTAFEYLLPERQSFSRTGRNVLAISPDGTALAYVANQQLYLRRASALHAQAIPGTDDDPMSPVFSPDGQWLAYFAHAGTQLRKVAVAGGAPVAIAELGSATNGADWQNHQLIFASEQEVYAVPDTGGEPRKVIAIEPGQGLTRSPQLLDDGRHVLFELFKPGGSDGDVVVQTIDRNDRQVIVRGGGRARLLPSGQLIYAHGGNLLGAPLDSKSWTLTSPPVALADGISMNAGGQFALSRSGTLAYVPGLPGAGLRSLMWVDRQGHEELIPAPTGGYYDVRLSPDGAQMALCKDADIWIWAFAKETLTRLTLTPAYEHNPAWMPDGRHVIFDSSEAGSGIDIKILQRAADGTGTEEVTSAGPAGYPDTVSPDGRFLVYHTQANVAMLLPLNPPGAARPLVQTKAQVFNAEIAADGKWIAYQSNETSRFEVYVQPFPNMDAGRWQVSSTGGSFPLWSRNGRELFFLGGDGTMMATPIRRESSFAFDKPAPLFQAGRYYANVGRDYDVSPDGKRFVMVKETPPSGAPPSLVVVAHWDEQVRAKLAKR